MMRVVRVQSSPGCKGPLWNDRVECGARHLLAWPIAKKFISHHAIFPSSIQFGREKMKFFILYSNDVLSLLVLLFSFCPPQNIVMIEFLSSHRLTGNFKQLIVQFGIACATAFIRISLPALDKSFSILAAYFIYAARREFHGIESAVREADIVFACPSSWLVPSITLLPFHCINGTHLLVGRSL